MISNFPVVLNFNQLFLKLNWFICNEGPVYTTVEKATGHEKRAFLNCDWLKMQLLTYGCLH